MATKLHGKLERLHGSRVRAQLLDQESRAGGVFDADGAKVASAKVGLKSLGFHGNPLCRIEHFGASRTHGRYDIGSMLQHAADYSTPGQPLLLPMAQKIVGYLDIETNGLHDGCISFCIGAARWVDDGLELTQFGLSGKETEISSLQGFAAWCRGVESIVTFNGKSFDLPRLRSRFRAHKIDDPTRDMHHVDLMLVARRMVSAGSSCTLSNIERDLLNLSRNADVPGSEAPRRWSSFLRAGDAQELEPIFLHNRLDVLSLAALAHHFHVMLTQPVRAKSDRVRHGSLTEQLKKTYRLKNKRTTRNGPAPKKELVGEEPHLATPRNRLATTRHDVQRLVETGDWEQALPLLYEMMVLSPFHPYPIRILQSYYRSVGDKELATLFERRLSELEPF